MYCGNFIYVAFEGVFLILALSANTVTVNAIMGATTKTRAALLNSGTVGLGEAETAEVAEGDDDELADTDGLEVS